MTNKGVGGLLKKWGEGASLIRKEWKSREEKGKVDMEERRGDEMAIDDDDDEEEEEEEEEEPDDVEATPRMQPQRTIGVHSPQSSLSDVQVNDELTESLKSLTLVPNSVRFGRGGKSGGFIPRGQGGKRGKRWK